MIQDKNTATIESNLTGEKIAMGIAESATSHIMDILSKNLYSDAEMAVVREYSTNARDAHIEAGIERPIEVTLPTHLSPFLSVKDYGVGLDEQDIRSIYSQYGESTKRGTNDQVGMLGLGCKSAFAYTSQFTVTSVKDGHKITVVVSRDDDGTGAMTVADSSETDEPNGTEVIIPAKRWNTFEQKARDLFSYWQPGTVLVDGEEPKRVDGLWLNDNLCVVKGHQSYVVMGNVPYPVNDMEHGMSYGNALVAFVPIGSVEFTPAREALLYTGKTKAYIEQVQADFREAMKGAIQRAIDSATTPQEAIATRVQWSNILPKGAADTQYTYNGKTMPDSYSQENTVLVRWDSYKLKDHERTKQVMLNVWPHALWVTGYDPTTFTSAQKKKLVKWCEDNGIAVSYFILTPKNAPRQWVTKDRIIDWPTIKAVKLPRASGLTAGRLAGSYDIYEDGEMRYEVPADEIDPANLYYYVGKVHEVHREAAILAEEHDSYTLVTMYANRTNKFLRNFPKAKPVREGVQVAYDKWSKKISKADKIALSMHDEYYARNDLKMIDPTKVDDPEIVKAVKLANRDVSAILQEKKRFNGVNCAVNLKVEWENPLNNYPLFDRYQFRTNADHTYLYMNAVYAARQQKESK